MKQNSPQFITDSKGKKLSVVLDIKDYLRILERLEEIEDVKLYDEVKARKEDTIPFEEYLKQRKKSKRA